MPGLGWSNGLPLELGGGTSKTEAIHSALRAASGSTPGPIDGLEDLWRQAKAQAIASVVLAVEAAALQALPRFATAHIPVYEGILAITPPQSATEEDRRREISRRWTEQQRAVIVDLAQSLYDLDSRLSIADSDYALSGTVRFGKAFPPVGNEALGVTAWPAFSSELVLNATFTGGLMPQAVNVAGRGLLNRVLSAWVDFTLTNGAGGFLLDGGDDGSSVLDETGMS